MKKIILVLFILLFGSQCLAASVQDKVKQVIARKSAAAPACTTANDTALFDKSGLSSAGEESNKGFATKFTLASNSTITEYYIASTRNPYEDGDTTVCIYADDAGSPSKPTGSCIAGTSKVFTPPVDAAAQTVTLTTPQAINAGTYWVVSMNATATATHYKETYASDAGGRMCESADGSTWSVCYDDDSFRTKVMGCAP